VALVAGGVIAAPDIVNTKHNFNSGDGSSSGTWANDEICAPCHVPHGGAQAVAPLWSHTLTSNASWTVYDSDTLNATLSASEDVADHDESQICLSCHDDTVALAAFVGATSSSTNTISQEYSGSNSIIGTDLSNDHPVMFTYNTALATEDGELVDPSGTGFDGRLYSNRMECLSCHDPHADSAQKYFLYKDNTSSAICLDCHIK
jgi:predicted CXXCH cytochrome family protein